jgi:hypothetical protein
MPRHCTARSLLACLLLLGTCMPLRAADDIDALARDVERVESLRAVKDLQRHYAQYLQAGLRDEAASLFGTDARLIRGAEQMQGRAAIEGWLTRRGGGQRGLARGALHVELIDEPLVNLSVDGDRARGRWMSLALLGDGRGRAWLEGGIYENEYVREDGTWKIALSHYHAQYAGEYGPGWTNIDGQDLPIVPYHFTVDESGVPVPPATGAPPRSGATLAALEARIHRLNDEDAVRNLQHAYGYYVDRRMWDDIVDLFAADGAVQIGAAGIHRGKAGVREALERMGPAGLANGVLNDRPLFDTIVEVLPGGREAITRGIELGMLGDAASGSAHWEITVFRNRFVNEDGVWKLRELRLFPVLRAHYASGWGDGGLAPPDNRQLPAFVRNNPVTGRPVNARGFELLGASNLTGRIRAGAATSPRGDAPGRLAEARRRLGRSAAWDGTENVSSAYGYYIDDFQWPKMAGIFAVNGHKHSPFAGYFMGRERIAGAATAMYGNSVPARAGIAYHWRTQPVIHVAADGRSAFLRTRLLQPQTGKQPAQPGATRGGATFSSGMYPNDQTVLEDGIWRLWSLTIDEHYFTSAGWKGGWAGVQPSPQGAPRPAPSPLVTRYPPDLLQTTMGRRMEGFRGGTGETIQWPGILPMWFHYRNPVSGREPPFYWPDCGPCELRPEASMTRHGFLRPRTGPEAAEDQ